MLAKMYLHWKLANYAILHHPESKNYFSIIYLFCVTSFVTSFFWIKKDNKKKEW